MKMTARTPSSLWAEYLHQCPQAGFAWIDEANPAFHACACFQPTDDVLEIQDALAVQLDAQRGGGQ